MHNFSLNGVHTLRKDKTSHGFVHLVGGLQSDQQLQRLACDALVAESEISEIWETTQVQSGSEWEPMEAEKCTFFRPYPHDLGPVSASGRSLFGSGMSFSTSGKINFR